MMNNKFNAGDWVTFPIKRFYSYGTGEVGNEGVGRLAFSVEDDAEFATIIMFGDVDEWEIDKLYSREVAVKNLKKLVLA